MFRTPSEVMDRLSEVDYEEDYSGVGGDDEYEKKNHNKAETVLAHGETKQVNRLRVVLLSTMLGLMALASFGVYYLVREGEKAEFQSAFAAQGNKLVTGFQGDALRKMQSLESLSSVVTRLALETNATWPLVTFDDSARLLQPYLGLSNAISLVLSPVIHARDRFAWKKHVRDHQDWVDRDLATQEELWATSNDDEDSRRRLQQQQQQQIDERTVSSPYFVDEKELEKSITPYIKTYVGPDTSNGPWLVWWQYAPVIPNRWFLNVNRLAVDGFAQEVQSTFEGKASISRTWSYKPGLDFQSTRDFAFTQELLQAAGTTYRADEPIVYVHYPVRKDFTSARETVAVVTATVYWKTYFEGILSEEAAGLLCVVQNSLGQSFTYRVSGRNAEFLGNQDVHEGRFNDLGISAEYASFDEESRDRVRYSGVPVDESRISYTITVYPSSEMEDEYLTYWPLAIAFSMAGVFLLTCSVFLAYDWFVARRQKVVMSNAIWSGAILSGLFPENVKKQLMEEEERKLQTEQERRETFSDKRRLKSFLVENRNEFGKTSFHTNNDDDDDNGMMAFKTKPIADLFPQTTILFGDLVGFTAWSSTREPSQVFQLLESVYHSFDQIASRKRIFKVETVGDCYVAVTGLPDPRRDHAAAMCRFAKEAYWKMKEVVRKLEPELGPGTADLTMRMGIHSGPVTGGVLRGGRSRFQLFGDTMNVASRMETTGESDRVQISQDTADILTAGGKGHWLTKRENAIIAKGKGEMTTYWLKINSYSPGSSAGGSSHDESSCDDFGDVTGRLLDRNTMRLVEWNVETMRKVMKRIVVGQEALGRHASSISSSRMTETVQYRNPLDEIQEIIQIPPFDAKIARQQRDPASVKLKDEVEEQLRSFVSSIASLYHANEFHNFAHATHVTASVSKIFPTIMTPTELDVNEEESLQSLYARLHNYTFGITSDPLLHFAAIFSALVHDVDHQGIPNNILMEENKDLAIAYGYKSVAEQNSIDVAWGLFMSDSYKDLRQLVCGTPEDLARFRQVLVNSVMSTDIFDKDLKAMRDVRWEWAFGPRDREESHSDVLNRKATIVFELLIQASDVAHTMQHWHVYRKHNANLFREMYDAYKAGRTDKDPSTGWYEGELWFFDNYIIPLAKKLKECGVFGVRSDEFLNYATKNRAEWNIRGHEIVAEMLQDYNESTAIDFIVAHESDDAL